MTDDNQTKTGKRGFPYDSLEDRLMYSDMDMDELMPDAMAEFEALEEALSTGIYIEPGTGNRFRLVPVTERQAPAICVAISSKDLACVDKSESRSGAYYLEPLDTATVLNAAIEVEEYSLDDSEEIEL